MGGGENADKGEEGGGWEFSLTNLRKMTIRGEYREGKKRRGKKIGKEKKKRLDANGQVWGGPTIVTLAQEKLPRRRIEGGKRRGGAMVFIEGGEGKGGSILGGGVEPHLIGSQKTSPSGKREGFL